MTIPSRTRVAIVGAGPAGLVLSCLLHRAGIDTVVLEARSRAHVAARVRAGVLEQGTVDVLTELGAGARLAREAMRHDGFELRVDGERHRVPVRALTGRPLTFYGQQEVVKDLIELRQATGAPLVFEAPVEEIADPTGEPVVRYRHAGGTGELRCEVVVACDGFHGVGRSTVPAGVLSTVERRFPLAWLGVLAAVAPSSDVAVYAAHQDGFAMLSMRSPRLTRLYVQCRPDDRVEDWPDGRIWAALHRRLATDGWALQEGPIVERSVTPLRAFVAAPMQFGNLYLAGDAAHIVPPPGAKGLNLAVRDVVVLAERLTAALTGRDPAAVDDYTDTCLRHVWRAQQFACWLTRLLHVPPNADPFDRSLQRAELRALLSSHRAVQLLAEQHAGCPPDRAGGAVRTEGAPAA
ncbi:4-hydroxybenzoate 3-monooxygenase [Geodermatophilus sp. DF01-2]|uniref:4-hydroxybenzoate 3-monooxygenase n=1 Tax=Geodermatophilus sp. DF01-2 TaxID=2559610 RepID=UPI0010746D22|nr:4-hydroxybenzoate 3-monooxygenase [Geodermatophilus sp. DF01_2]TFV63992.1 4-hydroxybenzoate 3-monooxygenase [Geodermatophilus sp. DF01_2]